MAGTKMIAPTDDSPVTEHDDIFSGEEAVRVLGQVLPELEAGLATLVASPVQGRIDAFHDAVVGNQIDQQRCVVFEERPVAPVNHFGSGGLRFAEVCRRHAA